MKMRLQKSLCAFYSNIDFEQNIFCCKREEILRGGQRMKNREKIKCLYIEIDGEMKMGGRITCAVYKINTKQK